MRRPSHGPASRSLKLGRRRGLERRRRLAQEALAGPLGEREREQVREELARIEAELASEPT